MNDSGNMMQHGAGEVYPVAERARPRLRARPDQPPARTCRRDAQIDSPVIWVLIVASPL